MVVKDVENRRVGRVLVTVVPPERPMATQEAPADTAAEAAPGATAAVPDDKAS
jgi:hypothetical protein